MEIITLSFEETLVVQLNNQLVTILPKKGQQLQGDISFGIAAPKSISVDREEVYHLKKQNNQLTKKDRV
ncbi:carbon storage regulator [Legionella drozanskii]|uniref:Carbon storage regulator CsrA n=1 Tax=Legionella drozanskii LLAP-1 TaxID=1212489 RepID=A0A0W0SSP0_9GAMM|nr:carbon storage regulator [Legionella drozanskii]KTC86379.1 carbon storage regulator CsrA [Legionella drozanskii LLAP-1]